MRGILQTTWTLKKMIFQSVTLAAGKQKSGEVCLGHLGGGVPPGSPNPDPISDQKNVIFHTRLQTWPLKSIPILRPGFLEIMASLLRLAASKNSFGIETINTFVPFRSFLDNHTRF